ncbi:MAG TPA: hypothetical protein HA257_05620 [Candidatus Methanoperedenaceae archaeon]|nr:hypothetical protein [Candidatus Methanoperedenaceae archaeon]
MYTNRVTPTLSAWPANVNPAGMTARLWRSWRTVDSTGTIFRNHEGEDESKPVQQDGTFSFQSGPSFEDFVVNLPAANGIGVSIDIQDGQVFRSGFMDRLPEQADQFINIHVFPEPILITKAELDAAIPQMPIRLDDCRRIDSLVYTFGNNVINVSGTGTDSCISGVSFAFSCVLSLSPSAGIRDTARILEAGIGAVNITFSGSGVIPSIEAVIKNLLAGWFERDLRDMVRNRLQVLLDGATSRGLGRLPPLPAGVVLTVRRVGIHPDGIRVLAALGSFGDLFAKFQQVVARCFIATAAMGSPMHPHVVMLRDFRDTVLLQSRFRDAFEGLLDVYYGFSPPIALAMTRNKHLRRLLRYILVYPIVIALRVSLPVINRIIRIGGGTGHEDRRQ